MKKAQYCLETDLLQKYAVRQESRCGNAFASKCKLSSDPVHYSGLLQKENKV